jgi:hypothetical protein
MKTFTVAGYSRSIAGELQFRVANSLSRQAVLERCGCTDVNLIELPQAMTREQAQAYVDQQQVDNCMLQLESAVTPAEERPQTEAPADGFKMIQIPGTDRVIRYDLAEMTEAEKAQIRAEHNAQWAHLSHEDLV